MQCCDFVKETAWHDPISSDLDVQMSLHWYLLPCLMMPVIIDVYYYLWLQYPLYEGRPIKCHK